MHLGWKSIPELGWPHRPRDTALAHEHVAGESRAVVHPRAATPGLRWMGGQLRFDDRPQFVSDPLLHAPREESRSCG